MLKTKSLVVHRIKIKNSVLVKNIQTLNHFFIILIFTKKKKMKNDWVYSNHHLCDNYEHKRLKNLIQTHGKYAEASLSTRAKIRLSWKPLMIVDGDASGKYPERPTHHWPRIVSTAKAVSTGSFSQGKFFEKKQ